MLDQASFGVIVIRARVDQSIKAAPIFIECLMWMLGSTGDIFPQFGDLGDREVPV